MEGAEGKAGHFEFIQASGKAHGLGEDLPYNNPGVTEHPATSTELTEQELDEFNKGTNETTVAPETKGAVPGPEQTPTQVTTPEPFHEATTPTESVPEEIVSPSGHILSTPEQAFIHDNKIPLAYWDKVILQNKVKVGDLLKIPADENEAIELWRMSHRPPVVTYDGEAVFKRSIISRLSLEQYEGYCKIASIIRKMTADQYGKKVPKAIGKLLVEQFLAKAK